VANDYLYLQLDVEYIKLEMSKLYRIGLLMIVIMILRHSKLHMPEICGKICRRIYALHISPNSAYFASKSSAYFKKILLYKPASLIRWLTTTQRFFTILVFVKMCYFLLHFISFSKSCVYVCALHCDKAFY